jgi:hypothetical protein
LDEAKAALAVEGAIDGDSAAFDAAIPIVTPVREPIPK